MFLTARNADLISILLNKHKRTAFETIGFMRFRKIVDNDAIQGMY